MRPCLLLIALCASLSTLAQSVVIKKVELAGEKIIVTYDLEDSNPNNEYLLNLYASKDNFATPLTKVTGDVGIDVKPGAGKRIEWSIREEYGPYKGKLALEVKGKVYSAFVRLQEFDTKRGYKRGNSHNIKWRPGNANPINIELYKGGERVAGDVNHPNNGAYTLFIPAKAKPGKDYRLKISDSRNPDEVIYTPFFRVTPKIPIYLKALPLVAAAVVVIILTKEPPEPPGPPGQEDIVDPPQVP